MARLSAPDYHKNSELAEREGFEPPVPFGTLDFESSAIDQLGHRSTWKAGLTYPPADDKGLSPPARGKEAPQKGGRAPLSNPCQDVGTMVQCRMAHEVKARPNRTRPRIGGAVYQPVNTRIDQRASTHGAGLQGHHEGTASQAPAPQIVGGTA